MSDNKDTKSSNDGSGNWAYIAGYDAASGANFDIHTGNDFVTEAIEAGVSYATGHIDDYYEGYEAGMDKTPPK
jgi:hypothetical protein